MIYLHVRHIVSVVKSGLFLPFQHRVYLLLTTLCEIQQGEESEDYDDVTPCFHNTVIKQSDTNNSC